MAIHDERDTVSIPHPSSLPFLGNALDLLSNHPLQTILDMGQQYGEIFSLRLRGQRQIFVNSQRLLQELCDERRFKKAVVADLAELRDVANDGLFTAHTSETNWEIAHRTLVPAFGPLKIQDMFDPMKDLASQLVLKWARYGPLHRISVTDDFTRLTLDTLALCAMDYRFNSFYSERLHPFVDAMTRTLKYSQTRANRGSFLRLLGHSEESQWTDDIDFMRRFGQELIDQRVASKEETKDLLQAMLEGKDPKTGNRLTHDSVIDNMITFLIAGHETTSGVLSFVFYFLLKNPQCLKRAQEEVDTVLGNENVQYKHLAQLEYIAAVLRETLRLQPTAPGYTLTPLSPQGEVLGGKYYVPHGEPVIALLHNIHRDKSVYGEQSESFDPERMLGDKLDNLPPCSWKPFGNGARGCIGRPFAWQEMLLAIAALLKYLDFSVDDCKYELDIAETLTVKPKDFFMHAKPRPGWDATSIEAHMMGRLERNVSRQAEQPSARRGSADIGILNILYGSNTGTCEALARSLASDATANGFRIVKLDTLDSVTDEFPSKDPTVIITTSYEGLPCDNAAGFVSWLERMEKDRRVPSRFAVFGCGHSDWRRTFHKIPRIIDTALEKHGGERICQMGTTDVAQGNIMSDFQTWEDENLWPALKGLANIPLIVDTTVDKAAILHLLKAKTTSEQMGMELATVVETFALSRGDVSEKRHIKLRLPSGMGYVSGDYCAILPRNPPEEVDAVMTRFQLAPDSLLCECLGLQRNSEIPSITARDFFSSCVELSQPATKRDLATLVSITTDTTSKATLQALRDLTFGESIIKKRVSLLRLLWRYRDIRLPLSSYITSLMAMRVRQYSISSSPLSSVANTITLTYSVLNEPAWSGDGMYLGAASNHLAWLKEGDTIPVSIKPCHQSFRLPEDPSQTPIIMVAAGTGIAPFHAFLQERAAQAERDRILAPARLYFGCHHPDRDDVYRDEIDGWERSGVVSVRRAYSRAPELSNGRKHVDELVKADASTLWALWQRGAKVYVCGSRGVGSGVERAVLACAKDVATQLGEDDSDSAVAEWFDSIRGERYVTDIFD